MSIFTGEETVGIIETKKMRMVYLKKVSIILMPLKSNRSKKSDSILCRNAVQLVLVFEALLVMDIISRNTIDNRDFCDLVIC